MNAKDRLIVAASHASLAIALAVGVAIAVFTFDLMLPMGVAGAVPYMIVVLITLWIPRRSATVVAALAVTLLTVLGFWWSPSGGNLWVVFVNRGLAILVIWTTAGLCLQRKRARWRLRGMTHVLNNVVTICANCKDIRLPDGSWTQIESYVGSRTAVEFTHSVCPACENRLYREESFK